MAIKTIAAAADEIETAIGYLVRTLQFANNTSATVAIPTNYASIEISEKLITGTTARLTVSNAAIFLDGQTGSDFSITSGTASKTNVTFAAGLLTIQNKLGLTAQYVLSIRIR